MIGYTGWAIPDGNVVQVADASGRVLWSANKLIEFTVLHWNNGTSVTYQAEKGMTWKEWANSDYSTTGGFHDIYEWGMFMHPIHLIECATYQYRNNSGGVRQHKFLYSDTSKTTVLPQSDTIIDGATYYL